MTIFRDYNQALYQILTRIQSQSCTQLVRKVGAVCSATFSFSLQLTPSRSSLGYIFLSWQLLLLFFPFFFFAKYSVECTTWPACVLPCVLLSLHSHAHLYSIEDVSNHLVKKLAWLCGNQPMPLFPSCLPTMQLIFFFVFSSPLLLISKLITLLFPPCLPQQLSSFSIMRWSNWSHQL